MLHLQNQIIVFSFLSHLSPDFSVQDDSSNCSFAHSSSPVLLVRTPTFKSPFTRMNIIVTFVVLIITILNILLHKLLQFHESNLQEKQGENVNIKSEVLAIASEQLLRHFELDVITHATNNFDESQIVGKGGFGKVYKGFIDDGAITVAIKRLNHTSKQGVKEFVNEIELLSKFRHRNLISLIGYCDDSDEMILVYEYMERGSLADHLFKVKKSADSDGYSGLSWVQRLEICIGAAQGLEYLHSGTNVIHRDMKSSNILLDHNLTAKVSDFGISRLGPTDESSSHVSTKIKGTRGYVDPEYLLSRKLTKKSDVYSFGVVLFEVLSGRPVVDLTRPEEEWGLVFWAQQCIKEEAVYKIVDPNLSILILTNSLDSFVKIANRCLKYRSKKRPTMAEVVASLESSLALQERTDSSMFDNDLLFLGSSYGNAETPEYPSGRSIDAVHLGNDQEITRSGNDDPKYDKSNKYSHTKSTRLSAFVKIVLKGFSKNSQWKNKKSLIYDESKMEELLRFLSLQDELISFGFKKLKTATESFADENKLGHSRFGPIYKGTLPGGPKITVKRLTEQGLDHFNTEMIINAKLQHRNLVRMLGWCIDMGEILMVLEYVPNKSLANYLFDPVKKIRLDWRIRFKIIKGIVQGILSLHQDSRHTIIHRDLKAVLILLDAEMNPKISGFGLAKLFRGSQSTEFITSQISGTRGYMAPEYVMEGRYSVKSDIYSFGVLLLEIIRGEKNNHISSPENRNLIQYAWKLWSDGEAEELIDSVIARSCPTDQVLQCVHVAMLCLQESADHRPTISDVMMMLESENTISFPSPTLPSSITKQR